MPQTREYFLDTLSTMIQKSPFSEAVISRFFTNEALAGEQHLFLGLASLFTTAFPPISDQQELLLNAATYLGAKGIYQLDAVLDQQVQGKQRIDQAFHGQLFLLESQRLLSQLFSIQDAFWPLYYKRVHQHYQELSLSKNLSDPLTEAAYWELLEHKYAMLYCPVDALFFLTGQTHSRAYGLIADSLRWFSKGYNLPNEVMGLADDLPLQINNYAYWRLKSVLDEVGLNFQVYSPDELQKLLYASGLGNTLMDEAIAALQKAAELAMPLELAGYQALIQRRITNVEERKAVISEALAQTA